MVRMKNIEIYKDIHMDEIKTLKDVVTIDKFGKWDLPVKRNEEGFVSQHKIFVELDFFKDRIIKYVENQHTQEEIDEIVLKWDVPSYNLIKGLGDSNGRTFCSYEFFVDDDGYIDRICVMTERNCNHLLDWLLEMVYQSK